MIEMKGALLPEKAPLNAMQGLVHVELVRAIRDMHLARYEGCSPDHYI